MAKISTTLFIAICLITLFASSISCAATSSSPKAEKQIVTVQRGNLAVSVQVDGNLVMPQAFDLRFGAPGNVKDVMVEEGDFVKAGTVLAKLDDSSQQLDIKSANCSLQQTLSNLYETIPAIQQGFMGNPDKFPQSSGNAGFPSYYPNASALLSSEWYGQEILKARDLFQRSNYGEAASELRIAVTDLESCLKIIKSAMESNQSGLGSIAPFANQHEILPFVREDPYWLNFEQLQKAIERIKQYQADVQAVQLFMAQGNYARAGSMFGSVVNRVENITRIIISSVNSIQKRYDLSYPDKDICLYFYRAAEDRLNKALLLVEKGEQNSADYNEDLRIARHYLELCNSIMGSNVMVLEHGLSLKNYQQYNVDLAKAAVTLENTKTDLLKTIIIAPIDGTVVSVGVKRNDILSAMDYSSRSAVQLVDTRAIKFQGLVDEIDILKIKTGQKARITVDAVPSTLFTGTVTFISPYGAKSGTSNVVKFAITIELDPSDIELKGGLSSTADVAVSNVENVLLIPLAAVTTTPAGSSAAVINEATGQSEKRPVTLGNQNQQFVEVVSGLKEGDKVLIEKTVTAAPVLSAPPPPPPRN